MADNVAITAGAGTTIASDDIGGVQHQRVKLQHGTDGSASDVAYNNPLPVYIDNEATATFRGRASTYRAIGRAGTTARRMLALWNAAGSGKTVRINQIAIDIMSTTVVAVTVIAPPIRVYKITAIPTNGTALTKVAKDNLLTSSASISLFQDASADGTNSATPLAATTTAGASLTNEFASRLITGAGFEMMDRAELLTDRGVLVRAGDGIVLSLDITLATQDAAGTHTLATIDWAEFAG